MLGTLFGSHVNQAHLWFFRAKRRFFVPCMPKSERKNKSFLPHILALRLMHLWTEEEKAGRGQCPGWVVNPGWGWIPPVSTYMRVLCYLWNYHGDTLKMEGCLACLTSFTPGSGSAWIDSVQALLLYMDDVLVGPRLARKAFQSSSILTVFSISYDCLGAFPYIFWQRWAIRYRIIGSMAFY